MNTDTRIDKLRDAAGDIGRTDMTCKRCSHPPESHSAGVGQCYACPPLTRCVCWEPRNQLAKLANEFGR